ncbi:hypothetical protein CEUSTIGMA_g6881.t1 [Chlamydomonas eustigma]|uniref:Protein kinase domain-containing protein n=1 Tax=Chlamydomonas eustigma TaxID=1157962 RepID=A0A250X9J4_9CHLO|nr:hypothetical protein CEUSTIGMA_g6881.t1 [Chlamydomonas eustigma]|eukprot:GAX79440.1 hypothetical protein CEUSTIGMA_g6881.t1 [Chlamydomonas eustigma]
MTSKKGTFANTEVQAHSARCNSLLEKAKELGLFVKIHSEAPLAALLETSVGSGGIGYIFPIPPKPALESESNEQQQAVKITKINNECELLSAASEARVCQRISHPLIAQPRSTYVTQHPDTKRLFLWQHMPLISGKDLEKTLRFNLVRYDDRDEFRGIAFDSFWMEDCIVQIVTLVNKLHSQGVLHKDLKPGNIMVENDTGYMYLIDFGFSTLLNGKRPSTIGGTPLYQPPELMRDAACKPCVAEDWYAVGVLLGTLIIGEGWFPFHQPQQRGSSPSDILYYMMHAKGMIWPEETMNRRLWNPDQWRAVLEGLTQRRLADRWGIRQLLLSPLMSEEILSRVAAARPLLRDDIQELQDMRGRFMEEEFKLKESAAAEQLLMKQKEINAKDSLKQHSRADDDLIKTHDTVIASGEQVLSSNQEEWQTVTRGRKNKVVVRKEAATLKQVIAKKAVPGNLVADASKTEEAVQAVMKAQGEDSVAAVHSGLTKEEEEVAKVDKPICLESAVISAPKLVKPLHEDERKKSVESCKCSSPCSALVDHGSKILMHNSIDECIESEDSSEGNDEEGRQSVVSTQTKQIHTPKHPASMPAEVASFVPHLPQLPLQNNSGWLERACQSALFAMGGAIGATIVVPCMLTMGTGALLWDVGSQMLRGGSSQVACCQKELAVMPSTLVGAAEGMKGRASTLLREGEAYARALPFVHSSEIPPLLCTKGSALAADSAQLMQCGSSMLSKQQATGGRNGACDDSSSTTCESLDHTSLGLVAVGMESVRGLRSDPELQCTVEPACAEIATTTLIRDVWLRPQVWWRMISCSHSWFIEQAMLPLGPAACLCDLVMDMLRCAGSKAAWQVERGELLRSVASFSGCKGPSSIVKGAVSANYKL